MIEIDWTNIVIMIATILITGFLLPFLKAKYAQIKTESLDYWLRVFMSAAETYFADGEGKQKKEWVIAQLQAKFPKLDIAKIEDSLEAMFRELVVEGILHSSTIA